MKFTKFTAGLVALSIATAGISAAPARASNEDLGLALGGLLTLFVIGKAIEDAKDKERPTQRVIPSAPVPPKPPKRVKTIPTSCVQPAFRRGEWRDMAMANCVSRYTKLSTIPEQCETRVRTRNGEKRTAFKPRCLRKNGYVFTGRSMRDNWHSGHSH